jgi:hypothetical protein
MRRSLAKALIQMWLSGPRLRGDPGCRGFVEDSVGLRSDGLFEMGSLVRMPANAKWTVGP